MDRMTEVAGRPVAPGNLAIGIALAIVLAAVAVFIRAGAEGSLGPLDLDTADRLALGLWVAAPILGGLVASRSSAVELRRAARDLGLVVGLVVAIFPAAGTGEYTCSLALPAVPLGYLLGRVAVGGLVGLGLAIALLVSGLAARRPMLLVPGVVLAALIDVGASAAASQLFYNAVRCL